MRWVSEGQARDTAVGAAPGTRPRRAHRHCRAQRAGTHSVLLAGEHDDHDVSARGRWRPGPGGPEVPGLRHDEGPTPPGSAGPTAHADVLVVDDDADVRTSMAAILRGRGLSVLEAPDGQSAKDTLDVTAVGVLVLDLHMSPRDGVWLLDQLHEPPAVILVSAFATFSEADMRERFSATVSHFVVKPVPPARLIALVEEVLGHPPS